MSTNRIITISGIHGVGKSTIILQILKLQNFAKGLERPKNPFQTSYEAMLFFISAFSWRDKEASKVNGPILLDRWSYIDIGVYIKTLESLKHISTFEASVLFQALEQSYCKKISPSLAIFLDDEPSNILVRIKVFRDPSKHHIFERDLEFISKLREIFLSEFEAMISDQSIENANSYNIVKINKRSPEKVAEEIIGIINFELSL